MQRLDLDLLHTLVTIADTGSLSGAAPLLCRSQSAVSEQVRKLELICGQPLLIRGKTGARLTPAGDQLLAHARQMLALDARAYQDMQGLQLAGDLRLAITDYFKPSSITMVLRRLRDQYPKLRLHVSIRKSASIEQGANSGDFDIGLSMRILDGPDHDHLHEHNDGWHKLVREPLHWIAHHSFDLEAEPQIPLVVLPSTCSLQQMIVRTLDRQGMHYDIAHSASGVSGLHLALSAGLGVTCLNASAIPEGMGFVSIDERLPDMPEVEFGLVPPQAGEAALVAEVRRVLAEHF
jgi:DNA-binding transcriptional LysR family regulator